MDLGLGGRRVLVVGTSAGVGEAVVRRLVAEGTVVAAAGRRRDRLDAVAASTGAHAVVGDASSGDGAGAMVRAAVEILGGLDGVVTVAGEMGWRGPIDETTDDIWTDYHARILTPVVATCRAALPALVESGEGAIVTVAAYSVRAPNPDLAPYAAMKSAVASVTKAMAKAYGKAGVRANCVAPGVIVGDHAPMLVERYGPPAEVAYYRYVSESYGMHVALERAGRPEEIADVISFLLSPRAAYVSGALVNVDGGTDF